jgi:hypothetical protein
MLRLLDALALSLGVSLPISLTLSLPISLGVSLPARGHFAPKMSLEKQHAARILARYARTGP